MGVWGQSPEVHPLQEAQLAFGVKGGFDYSLTDPVSRPGNYQLRYYALHGGYIGAFMHKPLDRHWALQPEVQLSIHGFGAQFDAGYSLIVPDDDHYEQPYIHIPLLLQYTVPAGVVLEGGLQPGVVLFNYEELKKADLAWVVGAGYIFPSGIGVDLRYTAGLTNLADEEDEDNYIAKVKNKVLQLGIVYVFRVRKYRNERAAGLTKPLIH